MSTVSKSEHPCFSRYVSTNTASFTTTQRAGSKRAPRLTLELGGYYTRFGVCRDEFFTLPRQFLRRGRRGCFEPPSRRTSASRSRERQGRSRARPGGRAGCRRRI